MKYIAIAFWLLVAAFGPARAAEPSPMDYVEFSVKFIARSKEFYASAFGWSFADYGPTHTSFAAASIGVGFTTNASPHPGGGRFKFTDPDGYEVAVWSGK